MRDIGVDIRIVGLITLAQAPWTFKFLWAPLMDRYIPPKLGRRRGWAFITQILLFIFTLMLAGVGDHPDTPWVVAALAFAIAFAAASQDIAVDAYAVDVLRPDEQAIAVGARNFLYRIGMIWVAGGTAITLAGRFGWPAVNVFLACLYLPMLVVTWKAPEPPQTTLAPRTLKDAARELRRVIGAHPNVLPLITKRLPLMPEALALTEFSCQALRFAGFDEETTAHAHRLLTGYVIGYLSLELGGFFGNSGVKFSKSTLLFAASGASWLISPTLSSAK